jgi:hypothetical protein
MGIREMDMNEIITVTKLGTGSTDYEVATTWCQDGNRGSSGAFTKAPEDLPDLTS